MNRTFLIMTDSVLGCMEVRGHRLGLESFPGMKVLLKLGARVTDVEALLADCVVAVETDQHRISWRINPLSGLMTGRQREKGEG